MKREFAATMLVAFAATSVSASHTSGGSSGSSGGHSSSGSSGGSSGSSSGHSSGGHSSSGHSSGGHGSGGHSSRSHGSSHSSAGQKSAGHSAHRHDADRRHGDAPDPGSGRNAVPRAVPDPASSDAQHRHPRAGSGSGARYGYGYPPYYYDYPYYSYYPWWGLAGFGFYSSAAYDAGYAGGGGSYEVSEPEAVDDSAASERPARACGIRLLVDPPEAAVFVDGDYAGTAGEFDGSNRVLVVSPGHHEIVLKLTGYRPQQFSIDTAGQQRLELRHSLVQEDGLEVVQP